MNSNENMKPQKSAAGIWLGKRDAWMRSLISNGFVSRNGKLAGVYVALRLSHRNPSTYPAMKTMARELGISTRQIARALKELEDENFIIVKRQTGLSSYYSLDL